MSDLVHSPVLVYRVLLVVRGAICALCSDAERYTSAAKRVAYVPDVLQASGLRPQAPRVHDATGSIDPSRDQVPIIDVLEGPLNEPPTFLPSFHSGHRTGCRVDELSLAR